MSLCRHNANAEYSHRANPKFQSFANPKQTVADLSAVKAMCRRFSAIFPLGRISSNKNAGSMRNLGRPRSYSQKLNFQSPYQPLGIPVGRRFFIAWGRGGLNTRLVRRTIAWCFGLFMHRTVSQTLGLAEKQFDGNVVEHYYTDCGHIDGLSDSPANEQPACVNITHELRNPLIFLIPDRMDSDPVVYSKHAPEGVCLKSP